MVHEQLQAECRQGGFGAEERCCGPTCKESTCGAYFMASVSAARDSSPPHPISQLSADNVSNSDLGWSAEAESTIGTPQTACAHFDTDHLRGSLGVLCCRVESPPPPAPPSPPPMPLRKLLNSLNARFSRGQPDDDLNLAGVMVRAFDAVSLSESSLPCVPSLYLCLWIVVYGTQLCHHRRAFTPRCVVR